LEDDLLSKIKYIRKANLLKINYRLKIKYDLPLFLGFGSKEVRKLIV